MRKVIAGAFVSLDGVMQAPGAPEEDPTGGFKHGGWTFPYFDETVGQALDETFSRPFDLLLGRKTYEIFAAHWPYEEGGPHDFIAKLFNKATKYVATTSSAPLKWTPSVAILEPATDVARLKRQDGPDLLIQGSSVLIQTLLDNDLIDQMNLLVYKHLLQRIMDLRADIPEPVMRQRLVFFSWYVVAVQAAYETWRASRKRSDVWTQPNPLVHLVDTASALLEAGLPDLDASAADGHPIRAAKPGARVAIAR